MKKARNNEIITPGTDACDPVREGDNLSGTPGSASGREDQVSEMIELVHRAGKMDRQAGTRKLVAALERKKTARKFRRLYLAAGSAVAAAAVTLYVASILSPAPQPSDSPVFFSAGEADVTVPTIIYTCQEDSVLYSESLDLDDGDSSPEAGQLLAGDEEQLSAENQLRVQYSKIIIPKGYTYKVHLSDGTTITLNAGSELKYPVRFQDTLREVEFKGEGFFEVAKGSTPFVVKSENTRVKVYGTRFNFLYSKELSLAEVVLMEGCVGMTAGGMEVKVAPGERIFHFVGDERMSVEKVDPSDYIGWLGSTFRYYDASLERIAHDLSRWYGVNILLSPRVKGYVYTMEFDKSSSIEWIMEGLALITGNTITREGGVYMIF